MKTFGKLQQSGLWALGLAAWLFSSAGLAAEHPGYTHDADASRDGIGKFYMGREISQVMGHQGAGWLERPQRQSEERPDLVVMNMDLQPGDVVADIGAGTGYFSFPIAQLIGDGRVLAVDIQQEMLDLMETRKAQTDVNNVEPILGQIDDPNLPANTVDKALIVDAYHEFSHPYEMAKGIFDGLKPGGKLYLLEYRGEDDSVPIKPLHKMTQEQAIKEMRAVGFEWDKTLDTLPWQHMFVFTKPLK